MTTYQDYYKKAYEQRQGQLNGFKRVLGATGLGKTYGIYKFIEWLQTQDYTEGLVYTTHRHNLLKEMEKRLQGVQIDYTYLRSNEHIAVELTKKENELKKYCDDLEKRYAFFSSIGKEITKDVMKLSKQVQSIKKTRTDMSNYPAMAKAAQELLTTNVSAFFDLFKQALKKLHSKDKVQFETLLKENGILWQLFPYIKFLYTKPRAVLLVTMDKLLDGFFDGYRTLHLADLSKNIIFIDEFEHQEKVILEHLCNQPNMNNMFEFVRQFTKVEDYNHETKSVAEAKKVLNTFNQELTRLQYPPLYDFLMEPKLLDETSPNKNKIIIFQSRRLTSTYNFWVKPDGNAWRIVKGHTPGSMRSRPLLYLFDRTMKDVLIFLIFCGIVKNQPLFIGIGWKVSLMSIMIMWQGNIAILFVCLPKFLHTKIINGKNHLMK